ncbi:ectoine/hydroxyectoine ABC transporter permease subunit EhuD [Rhodococcus sp. C26F]|jgi:polar amino acid transport system permease protein|uniref:Ectoine/hydroxyectoine ABC transporter permease subunit EhuD n=1 Tax=Rhodococcus rhodochrous TaxID=1829 RepID=A0AAW4XAR9_RHORH|nr:MULTISPECIES: ectoine/hydroxyectoine ABC transporter permease subunit EhuD [Rhodococcus]MCD2110051.1 ectoine/hydroxyectoine ABC transporter permease subunit EhuD [Rhodococcus rhodochrous]MCR8691784.1 ectoine/hydroxyectoine ABC transporter permease subunit EhuD [Rhodococcus pyridinivorans]QHG84233.1 ectoine/hydroxyectoine ABC transporter permease subunit EhuD [Rhodococcus rhodochrous]QOH56024.1 ectoine/hydroxyectoine ABC transporter permease subunit EhuD [Rhodococcus rhodochrous]WAL48084.1 e
MTVDWSWERAADALPVLLEGFRITLLATVLGFVVAAVLGLVVAVARRSLPKVLATALSAVVQFIRLTPLVVQLLFVYYLLPQFSALQIGIAVLGIHYSTYMAEVYRAGIDAVPKGQWEACRALSLSPMRTWRAVILPQAVRRVVPALGNYAVSLFKDTPFLFTISVVEMVTAAQQFGARNFQYLEPLTLAGLIFLLASYPTSLLVRRLERRLAY